MFQPLQTCEVGIEISRSAFNIGLGFVAGYLSGFAFSIADPLSGAVFGSSSVTLQALFEHLSPEAHGLMAKVKKYSLFFFINTLISTCITTLAGFPISLSAALNLTAGMLLVSLSIGLIFGCLCCRVC